MIEIINYEVFPKDKFDGRQIHYYFHVFNNGLLIKENYAYIEFSGSLLSSWETYLSSASNDSEYDEILASFGLKLIEQEVINFSKQDILDSIPLEFKFWSKNAPTIEIENIVISKIVGHQINFKKK